MFIAKRHHARFLLCLTMLLAIAFIISLLFGAVPISIKNIVSLISFNADAHTKLIVLELRFPRALLTLSIGGLLALSGAVMQGLFRNPLADPSLVGVTAGASLGASLVIFFGFSVSQFHPGAYHWGLSATVLGASLGGGASVFCIYKLATRNNVTSVVTMLLAGIALAAFVGGLNSLMKFFSDSETLRRMSLWHMGRLDGATMTSALFSLILFVSCVTLLFKRANTLNAFLLGESEARHLGVSVQRAKKLFICVVALATGFSVAIAGTISFVGLIVPHAVRFFVGPGHRILLPASALTGACLLLIADVFARTILAPIELPVGLLTALLGAPVFILLLRKPKHFV